MSVVRRRQNGPTDDPGEFSDGSYDDNQDAPGGESDYESADQSGSDLSERQSGDGQARNSESEKPVDDDEDRRNPQYIPKKGTFYEHDDRTVASSGDESTVTNTTGIVTTGATADTGAGTPANGVTTGETGTPRVVRGTPKPLKSRRSDDRWIHDKFNERDQAPKSREELVASYGYDIRVEDAPPLSRRHKKYSRGPAKYTRTWEDENAYGRTPGRQQVAPQPPSDDQFPTLKEGTKGPRKIQQGRQRTATAPPDAKTTPPAAIPEESHNNPPRRSLPLEKPLSTAPHKKPFGIGMSGQKKASLPTSVPSAVSTPTSVSNKVNNSSSAVPVSAPVAKRLPLNIQVTVSPQSGQSQRVTYVQIEDDVHTSSPSVNNVQATQQQESSRGKRYSNIRQRPLMDNNYQPTPVLQQGPPQLAQQTIQKVEPVAAAPTMTVMQIPAVQPMTTVQPSPASPAQAAQTPSVQAVQSVQHRYIQEYQQATAASVHEGVQTSPAAVSTAQHLMHQHRTVPQSSPVAVSVPPTNVPPPPQQQQLGPSPPQILSQQQLTSAPPMLGQRLLIDGQTMVAPHQHPHSLTAGMAATQGYVAQPMMPAQYMQANTGPVYAPTIYSQPPYSHQMYHQQYVYAGAPPAPPAAPTPRPALPPPPTRDITYYSAEQQQPVMEVVRAQRRPTAAIPIVPPPPNPKMAQSRPTPENDNIDRIVDNMFVRRQRPSPSPRHGTPVQTAGTPPPSAPVSTTTTATDVAKPAEREPLHRIPESMSNVPLSQFTEYRPSPDATIHLPYYESVEKGIADVRIKEKPSLKSDLSPQAAAAQVDIGPVEVAVVRSDDATAEPVEPAAARKPDEQKVVETSEA